MAYCSKRAVLAALFYWTLFNNVDTGTASGKPVLSVRPVLEGNGTSGVLISYRGTNSSSYGPWVRSLETFLDAYSSPGIVPGRTENVVACDFQHGPRPGTVCDIDVRYFGQCFAENNFGFHKSAPCIYLKLDTPHGWMPEYYNDTHSLPAEMPADLKTHLQALGNWNPALNTVWVSCDGVLPADKEFIGPVQYFPRRGYSGYHFVNNDAEGYLSPLVAVHFERPSTGIVINIKCKLWARNIDHNDPSAIEGGQFNLLID